MRFFNKIRKNAWIFRSLHKSIWFNLKTLPLSQAIKLPILLYKPHFIKPNVRGKIIIDAPIKPGMIKLGVNRVSIYPDTGIIFENNGTIIFKGEAEIGNSSAISVGEHGVLTIGNELRVTTAFKLICFDKITLEGNVLIGWNCMICDTDFHVITHADKTLSKGYGPITIGHDTWIANNCKIYKNVSIPHHCIVGADSILFKAFNSDPFSLICNNRNITIKATGISYNRDNDTIIYSQKSSDYEA